MRSKAKSFALIVALGVVPAQFANAAAPSCKDALKPWFKSAKLSQVFEGDSGFPIIELRSVVEWKPLPESLEFLVNYPEKPLILDGDTFDPVGSYEFAITQHGPSSYVFIRDQRAQWSRVFNAIRFVNSGHSNRDTILDLEQNLKAAWAAQPLSGQSSNDTRGTDKAELLFRIFGVMDGTDGPILLSMPWDTLTGYPFYAIKWQNLSHLNKQGVCLAAEKGK
jgi:hypothetical protein